MTATSLLRGRRVLVTGGGFIGGRLAERLAVVDGAGVAVMVSTAPLTPTARHWARRSSLLP